MAYQPKHYREDLVGLGTLKAHEIGIKERIYLFKQKIYSIDKQIKQICHI